MNVYDVATMEFFNDFALRSDGTEIISSLIGR
jgi:hypothetical protein